MTEDNSDSGKSADLRRRAEDFARDNAARMPENLEAMSPEEAKWLLHELRVHQIELEMQNEELHQSRSELEASRASYFDLYDLAPIGYLTISEKGLILQANLIAANLLGMARSDLVRQPFSGFIVREDQDIHYLRRNQLLKTGEPQLYELRMLRKDGSQFRAQIETAVAQDTDGAPLCRAVLSDITERKLAEDELKKHRVHLEELVNERTEELANTVNNLNRSNQELEQFAYVVSHDLQEPLRMVSSYTQLIAQRYQDKLDSDANDFIHFAVEGATRMKRLINDLLSYSRIASRAKPNEIVDSHSVLAEALANLNAAIEESGAFVTNEELPEVMADRSQLVQVFQNLVGNAIKFRGEEPPRIHVSAARGDSKWVFTVMDNGIGIEPQYFDQIFVIFQRLHGREEYSGTGIGLAICKNIIERNGGRIWLESRPGEGSSFHFSLPI